MGRGGRVGGVGGGEGADNTMKSATPDPTIASSYRMPPSAG